MIPNIHIHEHLMFERAKEWQHEIEQQHLLASLRKSHRSIKPSVSGDMVLFVGIIFRIRTITFRCILLFKVQERHAPTEVCPKHLSELDETPHSPDGEYPACTGAVGTADPEAARGLPEGDASIDAHSHGLPLSSFILSRKPVEASMTAAQCEREPVS